MAFTSINNIIEVTRKLIPTDNPPYTQLTADQIAEISSLEMEIDNAVYPFNAIDTSFQKHYQNSWTGTDTFVNPDKIATWAINDYGLTNVRFNFGNSVAGSNINKRLLDIEISPLANDEMVIVYFDGEINSDESPYKSVKYANLVYFPAPSPVTQQYVTWPSMQYDRESTDPTNRAFVNNGIQNRLNKYWELKACINVIKYNSTMTVIQDISMRIKVKQHASFFYQPNSPATVYERLGLHSAPLDIEDYINQKQITVLPTIA